MATFRTEIVHFHGYSFACGCHKSMGPICIGTGIVGIRTCFIIEWYGHTLSQIGGATVLGSVEPEFSIMRWHYGAFVGTAGIHVVCGISIYSNIIKATLIAAQEVHVLIVPCIARIDGSVVGGKGNGAAIASLHIIGSHIWREDRLCEVDLYHGKIIFTDRIQGINITIPTCGRLVVAVVIEIDFDIIAFRHEIGIAESTIQILVLIVTIGFTHIQSKIGVVIVFQLNTVEVYTDARTLRGIEIVVS